MAQLKLPQVTVLFKELGASAVQRGERGTVYLPLKDTAGLGTYDIRDATDIPAGLSADNKKQIELSLIGGVNAPLKVLVRVASSTLEADQTGSLSYGETIVFNYMAIPSIKDTEKTTVTSWVNTQRQNGKKVKAVLPKHAADKEYIVNFTTTDIEVGEEMYTTEQYCSRVAGLIAGTPLSISTTFQVLPEVTNVRSYTKTELDTAIGNGEFVIYNDSEKVKVARGVTSFTSTTFDKGDNFKKIKIMDIFDQMDMDITKTISDNYIGKFPNSYDNKVLMLSAINAYYKGLEQEQILDPGFNRAMINITANRIYLQSQGVKVEFMTDEEIKVANTDDKVFLMSNVKPLDTMEETEMVIYS